MKFAFCLFEYFPFGGLQRDFMRIAKECIARGHTVDVYTMRWEDKLDPEMAVAIISTRGWQNHTRCRNFVKKIQGQLKAGDYDLVVGFNKMPGLDVYYAADTCYQAKARQQRGFLYRLTPRFRHLIDFENAVFKADANTKVLLISPAQQAEFQHYYKTQEDRFFILPPGIAKDRKAPPDAEKIRRAMRIEWDIEKDENLLLMLGSGFKTKGLDRTLRAIAALPDDIKYLTKLWVVGDDHQGKFLRLAKKLGIDHKVKFLGGRNDILRILLAADLLLHPAYNENTGTVILEALAAGLPVIATDICGYAPYISTAEAGIVLPSPFDQIKFNKILADVLSLPNSNWRPNALKFAQSADIYSMPQRAVTILESIKR